MIRLLNYAAPLLFHIISNTVCAESSWSFIVLADWHGAEWFAVRPGNSSQAYRNSLGQLKYIYSEFGGNLAVLPGDIQNGIWYTEEFVNQIGASNTQQAVLQAGENCYGTVMKLFKKAGYGKVLMAVGDHELGDDGWAPESNKTKVIPEYRHTLAKEFNRDPDTGAFLFSDAIGNADSSPLGTPFSETSFAYKYKNVLFITVDAFQVVGSGEISFINRKLGIGGAGVVTGTVEGAHLDWFKDVLIEAQKDDGIKYIFVQSHLPILLPVRRLNSSGQSVDYAENSLFWKMMRRYGVDIYFSGEVHANTVTKDTESNLLQIVTRGNSFQNFLNVQVMDNSLHITSFNEDGDKYRYNKNYTAHGKITLSKSNQGTMIKSSGALKIIDRNKPLIHFNFEEIVPFQSRRVLGMKHDEWKQTLIGRKITMNGVECTEVLPNIGEFGQEYDGQISQVSLLKNGINGRSGSFTEASNLGIYSSGPHGGGRAISYALWFKTDKSSEMILIHYGPLWGKGLDEKDMFTLTLRDGNPVLYTNFARKAVTKYSDYSLNDNNWHHLAVSMPKHNCLLSEVKIYINGKRVESVVNPRDDHHIFFLTTGRIGIGGFAYGIVPQDETFPEISPFLGQMDDIYVWGKTLLKNDMRLAMKKQFEVFTNRRCRRNEGNGFWKVKNSHKCQNKCRRRIKCWGYESSITSSGKTRCLLFLERPKIQKRMRSNSKCGRVV